MDDIARPKVVELSLGGAHVVTPQGTPINLRKILLFSLLSKRPKNCKGNELSKTFTTIKEGSHLRLNHATK